MPSQDYVIDITSDNDEECDDNSIEVIDFKKHTQSLLDMLAPSTLGSCSSNTCTTKKMAHIQCPICFDEIKRAAATLCGHIFCLECIQQGISSSYARGQVGGRHGQGLCPLCRKNIHFKDVVLLRLKLISSPKSMDAEEQFGKAE